jgi:hypothetical protein
MSPLTHVIRACDNIRYEDTELTTRSRQRTDVTTCPHRADCGESLPSI